MRKSLFKKIKPKSLVQLDVGCGENAQSGWIRMDKRKLPGIHIVHDIEKTPWPIPKESVDRVLMSHLVEHLDPSRIIDIINEVWRISRPRGELMIATPYAGSPRFWQDPTHKHGWMEATAMYFDPRFELYAVYKPKPWFVKVNDYHHFGDMNIVMEKRLEEKTFSKNGNH